MKKLVSMLLALMLCLCGLTSAMAETATETTVEVFPYTVEDYKTYFDVLGYNLFGEAPVWAATEDGQSLVATIESWGVAVVMLDELGQVTSLGTTIDISMEGDVTTESNKFGQMVALIALSSKAAEDINSFTEENINTFTNSLMTLITSLMGSIADAMTEPVVVSEEIGGNLCSFYMSLDMNTMTMSFGFLMEP